MAKTNIFIETTIITKSSGYARTPSYKENISAKLHLYSLGQEVYHKAFINGIEQPGVLDGDCGMLTGRFVEANIGDVVTVDVYRVSEFYTNAQKQGTITGLVTAEGTTLTSDTKNLTFKAKVETKKFHKFK